MARYTGGLLEADTFPKVLPQGRQRGYVSYSQAMSAWEVVKQSQPWDPAEPDPLVSRFAADLHTLVGYKLGLDDLSRLRLYTATGSAMDWHGTDAWFEFDGVQVTMDVTKNPHKIDGYKADVMIGPDAVEDEATLRQLAEEIAQTLLAAQVSRRQVTRQRRLSRWQPT